MSTRGKSLSRDFIYRPVSQLTPFSRAFDRPLVRSSGDRGQSRKPLQRANLLGR